MDKKKKGEWQMFWLMLAGVIGVAMVLFMLILAVIVGNGGPSSYGR